jgi:hypothetical protein
MPLSCIFSAPNSIATSFYFFTIIVTYNLCFTRRFNVFCILLHDYKTLFIKNEPVVFKRFTKFFSSSINLFIILLSSPSLSIAHIHLLQTYLVSLSMSLKFQLVALIILLFNNPQMTVARNHSRMLGICYYYLTKMIALCAFFYCYYTF